MKGFFSFLVLAFVLALSVSCNVEFTKVSKSKNNEYKLSKANEYYVNGAKAIQAKNTAKGKKYLNNAHQLYDELLKTFLKGTPRYEEAFYNFAQVSYLLQDYVEAEMTFNAYMDNFPTGSHIEEAYFLRGKSLSKASPRTELDQANTQKAISLLQAYLATFPTGANAKEAGEILAKLQAKLEEKNYLAAKLYFDRQQYQAARITFNSLMEKFPASERTEEYAYKEVLAAYLFARNSIFRLQQERYKQALEDLEFFKSGYPKSTYTTEVAKMETDIKKQLEQINVIINSNNNANANKSST